MIYNACSVPANLFQATIIKWIQHGVGGWRTGWDSYHITTDQLSWSTFQTRRKLSRLQTLHKVFYRQLSLTFHPYYLPSTRSTRQYHPLHFILLNSSTTSYLNSYFSKTINDWNLLPTDIIEVEDTDTFRTR